MPESARQCGHGIVVPSWHEWAQTCPAKVKNLANLRNSVIVESKLKRLVESQKPLNEWKRNECLEVTSPAPCLV